MSYDSERVKLGRKPVLLVEIDLDKCDLDYGNSPCTAAGGAGSECYNTRATCQDLANYDNSATLTLKFSDVFVEGETFFHCIESSTLAPTVIKPDKGLGLRASIKITVSDFPHHDRGVDPYVASRSYTPGDQGTFFSKLFARNRHYAGRALRVKTGYIADPFSASDFETRNYIIDNIAGPDDAGRYTITAKDILDLADDRRAVAPAVSTGKLQADIDDAETSLTVTSGTESEYTESKYIRIANEIIEAPIADRSANVFSNLTRGTWNTEAKDHDDGDTVQACKWFDNENVVDLVQDLLVDYAGISSSYITAADWDADRDTWYSTATLNTLITEPEGINKLINELAAQFFFQIWWDEISQKIIFNPIAPPSPIATIPEITDADNIIADSIRVKRDESKRLSRVIVYYNPRSPIETRDAKDYKSFYARIDSDAESGDEYDDIRQKIIFARFIDKELLAMQVGGRLLARQRSAPRDIKFTLDAKDADKVTGDLVDIVSRALQGFDGAASSTRFQITSFKELTKQGAGTFFEFAGYETSFQERYGHVGPNTLNDYDVESDANIARYGFICLDTGLFSDGSDGYRTF